MHTPSSKPRRNLFLLCSLKICRSSHRERTPPENLFHRLLVQRCFNIIVAVKLLPSSPSPISVRANPENLSVVATKQHSLSYSISTMATANHHHAGLCSRPSLIASLIFNVLSSNYVVSTISESSFQLRRGFIFLCNNNTCAFPSERHLANLKFSIQLETHIKNKTQNKTQKQTLSTSQETNMKSHLRFEQTNSTNINDDYTEEKRTYESDSESLRRRLQQCEEDSQIKYHFQLNLARSLLLLHSSSEHYALNLVLLFTVVVDKLLHVFLE